MEHFFVVF